MNRNKNSKYEIISLGFACMPRAFLTQENLIPSKANGRKSMIFDLMPNPTSVISECIKNKFEDYFNDIKFEYHPLNRQNYWHNRKYDVYYVHDRDCKNNFNKFKKRYEQRIENFKEGLNNAKYTFFIHIPKSKDDNDINNDINNLYNEIRNVRGEKPFKLIIWDILDVIDNVNPEITVIKDIHPQKNDDNWWNPKSWNDETNKWKQNLLNDTKKEIEKNGWSVEYYENIPHKNSLISSILTNQKFISFMQNIFKVENDHDNNRKVMILFGITFKLKRLHNFDYSDVIIKLDGRMGNQMCQWAFGRSMEAKKGINPIFDDSKETLKLGCFKLSKNIKTIHKPLWNKILRKIILFRNLRNKVTDLKIVAPQYSEKMGIGYQPELFDINPPACINGYFQTEKYFSDVRDKLLEDFTITKKPSKQNQLMLEKIKSTNSVSVHFRRGDYTKARVEQLFGMCSENYYKNAIDTIAQNTNEPITLFIFSDDINWVRKNVKFDYETVYVDINSGKQGYFDLELMKNCKHNVIANSSFSWWGAWLNENPDKIVVAPTPWHDSETISSDDIVPESWIKIQKK